MSDRDRHGVSTSERACDRGEDFEIDRAEELTVHPGPLQALAERVGPSGARRLIQRKLAQRSAARNSDADAHAAAEIGTGGAAGKLPFFDVIQKSFGSHDVSRVQAHTDELAAQGAAAMGANGFARGDHVAFRGAPSLHTAAHEAAHVIQQTGGVSLQDGVGRDGDVHERHADAVADRVVRGESAEDLLDAVAPASGAAARPAIQRLVTRDGTEHGAPISEDELVQAVEAREAKGLDDALIRPAARELVERGGDPIPLEDAIAMVMSAAQRQPEFEPSPLPGPDIGDDASSSSGSSEQLPPMPPAMRAQLLRGRPAARPTGDANASEPALTPAMRARMRRDHAAYDLAPLMMEVQAALAQRATIKSDVPWSDNRKNIYRWLKGVDGVLNVAAGAAAVAGDFVSLGIASKIIAPVVLAKDAAMASANEKLSGGVSGDGAARSTGTNVGAAQAKSMIGPIDVQPGAESLNLVPIVGGAVKIGQGSKQIYDALAGALPEEAAGNDIVFREINLCRDKVAELHGALASRQAILRSGELAEVIGQLEDFLSFLDRQEEKARERFVADTSDVVTRPRANGGEHKQAMAEQHSNVMTAAALRAQCGSGGLMVRARAAAGGSPSTYLQILAAVEEHDALMARSVDEAREARLANVLRIYELCTTWLQVHEKDEDEDKHAVLAALRAQAQSEGRMLRDIE